MKRSFQPQPGPSSFKCTFCDATFSEDENRKKHIQIAHKNRIENKVGIDNIYIYIFCFPNFLILV